MGTSVYLMTNHWVVRRVFSIMHYQEHQWAGFANSQTSNGLTKLLSFFKRPWNFYLRNSGANGLQIMQTRPANGSILKSTTLRRIRHSPPPYQFTPNNFDRRFSTVFPPFPPLSATPTVTQKLIMDAKTSSSCLPSLSRLPLYHRLPLFYRLLPLFHRLPFYDNSRT